MKLTKLRKRHGKAALLVFASILTVFIYSGRRDSTDAFALQSAGKSAKTFTAKQILEEAGVEGGLIVHVGCGDGTLTAGFHKNEKYVVQGLATNAQDMAAARNYIKSQGLYGDVSARLFNGKDLPYIDNLANMIVVDEGCRVPCEEAARALAPYGVIVAKEGVYSSWHPTLNPLPEHLEGWSMAVKKYPSDMDEWQQYLHDADNNAVAHDTAVGPPRHLQWTTGPAWCRSHMSIPSIVSMVSSRGRLFSIEDKAPVENPFLLGEFTLVARDAFNGIKLWSYDFPEWEPVTRYVKDMAVQLQRRLAAIDDTVYCTPGLNAPVKAFDAATGVILKTYDGTQNTQEFAYYGRVLYVVTGDHMNAARYNIVKLGSKGTSIGGSDPDASFDGCGFDAAYAPKTRDISNPTCDIVAVDADSGTELWRQSNIQKYIGCTLAVRAAYLVYQTENGLFCLDPENGDKKWSVRKSISSRDGTQANTLVLSDDAVYAQEMGSLHVYSLQDGTHKWSVSLSGNYEKSADVFILRNAVWTGGSSKPKSYDLQTGTKIVTITQQKTGPMGHDRCYRNRITDRYYINSKTGGSDFVDLNDGTELPHYWVRGTCGFGVLPCNGLLYSTPFSCRCSMGVMIQNMNAFYTEPRLAFSDDPIDVETGDNLETGPAYGYIDMDYTATDWPTYRHDGQRSGSTVNSVPATGLASSWEFQLTTNPSALTIEDGKVFVSDVDAHTVYALDAADGHVVWTYVAGGRVDSPPTFYKGLVLFGSRDGWVYCLKADDGTLSWRFKGLPDKMIGAFGQLESAWPVCGSVLVKNDVAYFSAGRNSFVDGGIFQYGLNPGTGDVVCRSYVYGPFDNDGFPATTRKGYKSGIFVADGNKLYLRHKTFDMRLNPLNIASAANHLIATPGFLDKTPQHRTYWTVSDDYKGRGHRSGEMLVRERADYYEMTGFPVNRHSYFDPRVSGYKLFARTSKGWNKDIPMTTKAMLLAGDFLFVAGNPLKDLLAYNHNDRVEEAQTYVASYEGELGGVMWALSKADGSKLAEYSFDAPLVWDGLAAANSKLYLATENGKVICLQAAD